MPESCRWSLVVLALLLPGPIMAQSQQVEVGLDGGLEYAFDAELLTISLPFQRVRAAFPSGHRLAVEPSLSLTRLSSNGESLTAVVMRVGVLYDLEEMRGTTYARPFAGLEYADASFSGSETVFNLGAGIGTRTPIGEQLALRIEGSITGRFGAEGGADGFIGATVGLSFFTR
jgi:hypothetical protein